VIGELTSANLSKLVNSTRLSKDTFAVEFLTADDESASLLTKEKLRRLARQRAVETIKKGDSRSQSPDKSLQDSTSSSSSQSFISSNRPPVPEFLMDDGSTKRAAPRPHTLSIIAEERESDLRDTRDGGSFTSLPYPVTVTAALNDVPDLSPRDSAVDPEATALRDYIAHRLSGVEEGDESARTLSFASQGGLLDSEGKKSIPGSGKHSIPTIPVTKSPALRLRATPPNNPHTGAVVNHSPMVRTLQPQFSDKQLDRETIQSSSTTHAASSLDTPSSSFSTYALQTDRGRNSSNNFDRSASFDPQSPAPSPKLPSSPSQGRQSSPNKMNTPKRTSFFSFSVPGSRSHTSSGEGSDLVDTINATSEEKKVDKLLKKSAPFVRANSIRLPTNNASNSSKSAGSLNGSGVASGTSSVGSSHSASTASTITAANTAANAVHGMPVARPSSSQYDADNTHPRLSSFNDYDAASLVGMMHTSPTGQLKKTASTGANTTASASTCMKTVKTSNKLSGKSPARPLADTPRVNGISPNKERSTSGINALTSLIFNSGGPKK
jgi:hypothetical protein